MLMHTVKKFIPYWRPFIEIFFGSVSYVTSKTSVTPDLLKKWRLPLFSSGIERFLFFQTRCCPYIFYHLTLQNTLKRLTQNAVLSNTLQAIWAKESLTRFWYSCNIAVYIDCTVRSLTAVCFATTGLVQVYFEPQYSRATLGKCKYYFFIWHLAR